MAADARAGTIGAARFWRIAIYTTLIVFAVM